MIRKAAGPFYRTISGVRLCLELEEPQGPKGLDESEDEAAGAASGQKRPKKAKKGKGAARGSEWKHFVDWEEEGLGYPRNRTTFPQDDRGVRSLRGPGERHPSFAVGAASGDVLARDARSCSEAHEPLRGGVLEA